MAKPKDITGQRYGRLLAIKINEEETKRRNSRSKIWECLCDCGNTTFISVGNWGKTQSCGCAHIHESKIKIGDKYNNLTIVSKGEDKIEKDKSANRGYNIRKTWNCRCDCGNYKMNVCEKDLIGGYIKSCGCKSRDARNKKTIESLKRNTYDLTGDFGIGIDVNNKEFYFDLEDYNKIKEYSWNVKYDDYVETNTRKLIDGSNKTISLHRIVMNIKDKDTHIDHINHKPNDNRKENLRIVTRAQNQANAKVRIDNTSGTKGVYYCNTRHKWVASIQENKRQHSKSFKTKDEAILYRKYLEDIYQKEYSYQNSIGADK